MIWLLLPVAYVLLGCLVFAAIRPLLVASARADEAQLAARITDTTTK